MTIWSPYQTTGQYRRQSTKNVLLLYWILGQFPSCLGPLFGVLTCALGCQNGNRMSNLDSSPAPLYSSKPVWDIGTIDASKYSQLDHRFVLTNDSKKTIRITGIYPNCGCTVVNKYDKTIEPGQQTTIDVTFNPSNNPGRIEKQILVKTDASQDAILLRVVGLVRTTSVLSAYPNSVDFGTVFYGETKQRRVKLRRMDLSPIRFSRVMLQDGNAALQITDLEVSETELQFCVRLNSQGLSRRTYSSSVKVFCSRNTDAEIDVPVLAFIESPRRVISSLD